MPFTILVALHWTLQYAHISLVLRSSELDADVALPILIKRQETPFSRCST